MLNHGLEWDKLVLNELIYTADSGQSFNTLIPRWPTVGRMAYTVVRLVTHDCTRGLSTRYPTVDSMGDIDITSASVE